MNIVFDLDGTLIDSAPDIQGVANHLLVQREKPALSLPETRSFIGEGSAVFIRRMMTAREMNATEDAFEELHSEFLALYEKALDKAVFYPGVVATLQTLSVAGHTLGLCTNKPESPARAVLAHMELTRFFTAFTAGGMCKSRKPDPQMLHHVIAQCPQGPTLYVGDSEIDAETAQRADIPFALFSGGYRKTPVNELHHDWVFDAFSELPEIVEKQAQLPS
ncbi:MAG: phosphoglycolate phosphatase [Halioglobus sp.]